MQLRAMILRLNNKIPKNINATDKINADDIKYITASVLMLRPEAAFSIYKLIDDFRDFFSWIFKISANGNSNETSFSPPSNTRALAIARKFKIEIFFFIGLL